MSPFTYLCLLVIGLMFAGCAREGNSAGETVAVKTEAPRRIVTLSSNWYARTIVDAYRMAGKMNPVWDAEVVAALNLLAELSAKPVRNAETIAQGLREPLKRCLDKGCNDPLIRYLSFRYATNLTEPQYAEGYRLASEEMQGTAYPAIRKFYAAARTARSLKVLAGTNTPPEVIRFREIAYNELRAALSDVDIPVREVEDGWDVMADLLSRNTTVLEKVWDEFEPLLFKGREDSAHLHRVKGELFTRFAWKDRGTGWAHTVKEDQWEKFHAKLEIARQALEKAWDLDPKDPQTPTKMLTVCMGLSLPRPQMEKWFNRAMRIDPGNFDACMAKLYYLEPKWLGSVEEMLEFGRECLESAEWRGAVPMILVRAHEANVEYFKTEEEKRRYWKQDKVWQDVRSAFEKYYSSPSAGIGWRHDYVQHAYWAEKWDVLNEQLRLIGPLNYAYFGSKEQYEKIVNEARKRQK